MMATPISAAMRWMVWPTFAPVSYTHLVQGVGFRYRARYAAQSLELTGWVENEDDGSVPLEVQADPVKFRKLFALIQRSDYIQITAIRQKDIAPDRCV